MIIDSRVIQMSGNIMSVLIAKFGKKLVIWSNMDRRIANGRTKLSKNTFSFKKSDDREISTGFHDKKQRWSRRMGFILNYQIY